MRSLLARRDDPVSVTSTMASASSGGLTSVAPQLNSTRGLHAVALEIALRGGDEFGRDDLALQILHAIDRARFGNREHPAHFAEALLGVDQIGDGFDVGAYFGHPVETGQPGVENAVFDIAGHLLGADEHAFHLGIVDGGEVRARTGADVETGAAEQIDRGVFKTSLGNAEFQLHFAPPYTALGS